MDALVANPAETAPTAADSPVKLAQSTLSRCRSERPGRTPEAASRPRRSRRSSTSVERRSKVATVDGPSPSSCSVPGSASSSPPSGEQSTPPTLGTAYLSKVLAERPVPRLPRVTRQLSLQRAVHDPAAACDEDVGHDRDLRQDAVPHGRNSLQQLASQEPEARQPTFSGRSADVGASKPRKRRSVSFSPLLETSGSRGEASPSARKAEGRGRRTDADESSCHSCSVLASANNDDNAWWAALDPVHLQEERAWQAKLTPLQFKVLRMGGTEKAGTGPLLFCFKPGSYTCAGCGHLLYRDEHKMPSTCGWPAFKDACPGALRREFGKEVPEIRCNGCRGHIGHVFKSKRYPGPLHERHCVNSASIRFAPAEEGSGGRTSPDDAGEPRLSGSEEEHATP